ncbi:phospholipid scramblase 2-like, partial [Contarinia nasturtii]|uniref:phospholipid scramblase 2-like n=1 Tax=Contarinia nasturtii TaxID=265458 RepID=UPI0012D4AA5E
LQAMDNVGRKQQASSSNGRASAPSEYMCTSLKPDQHSIYMHCGSAGNFLIAVSQLYGDSSNFKYQPAQGVIAPGRIANSPPGLEYLTQVNQLLIKQQVELQLGNRFVIKNAQNQNIYWAKEDANCLATFFLGSGRPFNMKILDNRHVEVLHLYRPAALGFTDSIEVSTSSGQILGRIQQKYTLVYPNFKVKNHKNETILRIVGPAVKMSLGDVVFEVRSYMAPIYFRAPSGRISKRWSGLAHEVFTEADHFGISFPMDLDVRIKATLLGAVFFLKFHFGFDFLNDLLFFSVFFFFFRIICISSNSRRFF